MDIVYWLMLLKAPHLGVKTFYKALKHFESPQQVFEASHEQRKQLGLFRKETLNNIQPLEDFDDGMPFQRK